MKRRTNRIISTVLAIIFITGILTLFTGCAEKDTTLTCDIMKIGKADCIVIYESGHTVLIDAGETEDAQEIISHLSNDGVETIDYFIITHFDRDHIGSAANVIERFKIKNLILPDYTPENPESTEYLSLQAAIKSAKLKAQVLNTDKQFKLGRVDYEIMCAETEYTKNTDNNSSLMVALTHDGNRFLMAGDVEKDRLSDILNDGIGQYDFLKLPHHGNYNKKLPEFLEAIKPKYVVITCSAKNPPDERTIEALEAINADYYSTKDSEVHLTSNKDGIHIDQSGT